MSSYGQPLGFYRCPNLLLGEACSRLVLVSSPSSWRGLEHDPLEKIWKLPSEHPGYVSEYMLYSQGIDGFSIKCTLPTLYKT